MRAVSFVVVVGHRPTLEAEDGAGAHLQRLGAEVRLLDFWEPGSLVFAPGDGNVRALVFEAGDRPDLAMASLRQLRADEERLARVPALLAVPVRQVGRLDPAAGFDDFVVAPLVPAELYARIRALEWRSSEFSTDERLKMGDLLVDTAAHEVWLGGRRVTLTAKEFALLAFLVGRRGKVFSRDTLLARVWGARYEGGARTVDIHVRRLRAKLGDAFPLETLRGSGYKLAVPAGALGSGAAPGAGDPLETGGRSAQEAPRVGRKTR